MNLYIFNLENKIKVEQKRVIKKNVII